MGQAIVAQGELIPLSDDWQRYDTNCVLPPELGDGKPRMILSVLGDRPRSVGVDREGLMQAVRWRPLP